jgi:putative DNA methylase
MNQVVSKKKLIEVALPLAAINIASAREKSIRHGHPSTLHLWWARRPLAAARAVIFAQMVDDPSANPDLFPTDKAQEKERQRLFKIIEELVEWENTTNERVLQAARDEIWQSWRRACAHNADHPRAEELFNRYKLPAFHDPFAGGGALPLEAQRLGLEATASDLNPVAVLINKATIEIPAMFAGRPPVNPDSQRQTKQMQRVWQGPQGLAEDVRYYGQWMRDQAEKRIQHLYPQVEVTAGVAKGRSDLNNYIGKKLTVIAWLWARTVKSPNPAFANVDVPLASTFVVSAKEGKEAYIEPHVDGDHYHFTIKMGKPKVSDTKNGTKVARGASFRCLVSGTPIPPAYIYSEANAGRMGARLMAVVAEGENERVYLPPNEEMEKIAHQAVPEWKPDLEMPKNARWFAPPLYGLKTYGDIFMPRQLVALNTLADLVREVREKIRADVIVIGPCENDTELRDGGTGPIAYSEAIGVYLALLVSQVANHCSSVCGWNSANAQMRSVFARQAIPMVWDFAESNPFCHSSGSFSNLFDRQVKSFDALGYSRKGNAFQADVNTQTAVESKVVSTDPPYYDNIGYADLSDFFYVWLRHILRPIFPDLFSTLGVPKAEELVACPYRHGNKEKAENFFLTEMTRALHRLGGQAHPSFPLTIYYAFKQSEEEVDGRTASTGWETFLEALIQAGFAIGGTWPLRTEKQGRVVGNDRNALASSIVLVCHARRDNVPTATRRDFIATLKNDLPAAIAHLQRSNIAPVDLAQAAIGPGIAVYTKYSKVLDASGKQLSVREALALINQALDEVLAEQEGDFDADTRWALAWFEQSGFDNDEYGIAETLSKAKNTSVAGMVEAGVVASGQGKVRLLKPDELPDNWDPDHEKRLTVWVMVHQLVRALESGGEPAAAAVVAKLGTMAETARELAYRLYTICERKKRAQEALSYNALVQSWPEISRLARDGMRAEAAQPELFTQG